MTLSMGAWLAAAAGCATGAIDAYRREGSHPRGPVIAATLAGGAVALLCYAAFVAAGVILSLMMFSSAPDPAPALLGVLLGCGAFLTLRGLQSAFAARFGMPKPRHPSGRRSLGDVLDARPVGGPGTMWGGGVGLALVPTLYGLRCIVTGQGELGTLIWPSEVTGGAAVVLGLAWIGIGLFLHFHFFFGLHPRLNVHSRTGKSAALVMTTAGFTAATAWSVFAASSPAL